MRFKDAVYFFFKIMNFKVMLMFEKFIIYVKIFSSVLNKYLVLTIFDVVDMQSPFLKKYKIDK